MATYWAYIFRAPLRADLPADLAADLAGLFGKGPFRDIGVYLSEDGADISGPCLGPDTNYDGSRFFGVTDNSMEGGELRLSVSTSNLERDADGEGEDGLTTDARGTRLDVLLRFLSRVTAGEPGEVVGSMRTEWDDPFHAHPLIRCADGWIRKVYTEPDLSHASGGDWWGGDTETVDLPARIPVEFIRIRDACELVAELDCKGLRNRFRTVDGTLAPRGIAST